jgi:hypothetical protein
VMKLWIQRDLPDVYDGVGDHRVRKIPSARWELLTTGRSVGSLNR